jgi:hypothetical protein
MNLGEELIHNYWQEPEKPNQKRNEVDSANEPGWPNATTSSLQGSFHSHSAKAMSSRKRSFESTLSLQPQSTCDITVADTRSSYMGQKEEIQADTSLTNLKVAITTWDDATWEDAIKDADSFEELVTKAVVQSGSMEQLLAYLGESIDQRPQSIPIDKFFGRTADISQVLRTVTFVHANNIISTLLLMRRLCNRPSVQLSLITLML